MTMNKNNYTMFTLGISLDYSSDSFQFFPSFTLSSSVSQMIGSKNFNMKPILNKIKMVDNYERIQLDMSQGLFNFLSASICDHVNSISPSLKNCSSVETKMAA